MRKPFNFKKKKDKTLRGAKEFLRLITGLVPPTHGQRHHLVLIDDKLMVGVWIGKGEYIPVELEPGDLNMAVDELSKLIHVLIGTRNVDLTTGEEE